MASRLAAPMLPRPSSESSSSVVRFGFMLAYLPHSTSDSGGFWLARN
jgi:hypothetical protein